MEREASAASPPPSPLALFGSAHATRSPFQWDHVEQSQARPAAGRSAWRRSISLGRDDGVHQSARSMPADSFLHEPLMGRYSFDAGNTASAGPSHSSQGAACQKAASFSGPSSNRALLPKAPSGASALPPPVPPRYGDTHGDPDSGHNGDGTVGVDGKASSLSTALHSITETVRGSISAIHSGSLRSGSQDVEEDAGGQEGASSGSEADVEAALPRDFEHRMYSNEHPAFTRRLDAATDDAPEQDADAYQKMNHGQRLGIDAVTGFINAIVSLPVMCSFAVIIFADTFFRPYSGSLVRLVLLCAAIHQAVFTMLSSIKFAVGQVQDVGLIFLSAIASSVVKQAKAAGMTDQQTLGTVLVTLAGSTFLVGLLIVLVGKLKLASTVQYIPLSVIGGYLGYVGYFVAASGASLATGKSFGSPTSWAQLASVDVCLKLMPAVGGACLLWLVTHRVRSPWALPAVLLAMPAVFFAILYGPAHSNLAAARAAGWVQDQGASAPKHFWEVWQLFNLGDPKGILWSALPRQLPTVLALAFVVAFGSSLDVAAIQQDNPEELDYNKELVTVGLSNVLAGAVGAGMTGSYIFSQTVFSMRARVSSRMNGLVVVACELAIFMAPFSVIAYLPLFFFGGLMLWIGYEILKDWLVSSFQRMTRFEYLTLWLTFAAIMATNLELGIAAGLLLSALFFSFQYARVHVMAFSVVPSRSGVVRTFQQRTLLEVFAGRVVAVSLSGYIFFGSSVKISDKVCEIVRQSLLASEEDSRERTAAADAAAADSRGAADQGTKGRMSHGLVNGSGELEGSIRHRATAAVYLAPRFCLLDFRRVTGMDGTAGRTFSTLRRRLQQLGIELVIAHLPLARPEVQQLLLANGVIPAPGAAPQPGMCRAFTSMDEGLHYCEEVLLDCAVHYGLCRPPASHVGLAEVLELHLEYPRPLLPGAGRQYKQAAGKMAAFMHSRCLAPEEVLFRLGDPPDAVYVIQSGSVLCQIDYSVTSVVGQRLAAAAEKDADSLSRQPRLFQYTASSIVGELDFFLQRPRSFLARADSPTELLVLPRPEFERMAAQAPELATLLQAAVLRCTSLSAAHALEALEKAGQN